MLLILVAAGIQLHRRRADIRCKQRLIGAVKRIVRQQQPAVRIGHGKAEIRILRIKVHFVGMQILLCTDAVLRRLAGLLQITLMQD